MKREVKALLSEQMSKISRAMSKEQRQANGRKAWQTRIKHLEAQLSPRNDARG